MHLSIVSPPPGGGGGDTLEIRLPKQSLSSGIRPTTFAQGWDLRIFNEKISKKLCLNLKVLRFWTQNCHIDRELDPSFSKMSYSLG